MTHHPGELGGNISPQAFGVILRETRLSLGRTLEDVEQQTRILVRHLTALEAGEFDRLPSGIYARGFVHNYAAYLRLNPQEMVRLFTEARGETETFYRPQPVARPVSTAGPISPNFVVIVFVVGMLAVVTAWGYTLLVQPAPPRPLAAEPTVANATPTAIINRTVAPTRPNPAAGVTITGSSSAVANAATAPVAASPSATPATSVTVVLKATGDAYYTVSVDGQQFRMGLLKAGDTLDVPTGKSVKVQCGKPSNVTYTVNGQDRGVLPNEAFRNAGGYEITPGNANMPAATPTAMVRRN